jgi:hypothetical protein
MDCGRAAAFVDDVQFDLRLAIRGLVRDRGFTLAAVAMLTIALALNTTVFAVVDAMLFRGYPGVVRNDRLLYVQERDAAARCCVAYADFEDWRRERDPSRAWPTSQPTARSRCASATAGLRTCLRSG